MSGEGPIRIVTMHPWLAWSAVGMASAAAIILLWYLFRRPPLGGMVKGLLLLGFGVLPLGAAMASNAVGFQHMKHRVFCGSCHVMEPFTEDAADPRSLTLASRHSRNAAFGDESCYTCHQDYGMFGTVATKVGGLRHVWEYYTGFDDLTIEEALPLIEIYEPFPNASCIHCHSTEGPLWLGVDEHSAVLEEVRSGETSCASASCHGPPHPTPETYAGPRTSSLGAREVVR
jgi:cytochrome c-type protein NapC